MEDKLKTEILSLPAGERAQGFLKEYSEISAKYGMDIRSQLLLKDLLQVKPSEDNIKPVEPKAVE